MRAGLPLLCTLSVCATGSVIGAYGSRSFVLAVTAGAIAIVAGVLVVYFRDSDPALFLMAQPCIFLSWDASPLLAFLFEAILAVALLSSTGLIQGKNDLSYCAAFLLAMGIVTLLLSGYTHVVRPLAAFIFAAGIACILVLGLAYHTMVRAGGEMQ